MASTVNRPCGSRCGGQPASDSTAHAALQPASDSTLDEAIRCRLLHVDDGSCTGVRWRIEQREGMGRCLVAGCSLPAGSMVFCERPLIVAPSTNAGDRALRGGVPAVALALMRLLPGPDTAAARLLQEPRTTPPLEHEIAAVCPPDAASQDEELHMRLLRRLERASDHDGWVRDVLQAINRQPPMQRSDGSPVPRTIPLLRWALGVAAVNSHGAGRGFDGEDTPRGVLCLLGSMMPHSCIPSASISFAPERDGSTATLHTARDVQPGEPLSVAYVCPDWPISERRQVLLAQHGFVCRCERCEREHAAAAAAAEGSAHAAEEAVAEPGEASVPWEPFLPRLLRGAVSSPGGDDVRFVPSAAGGVAKDSAQCEEQPAIVQNQMPDALLRFDFTSLEVRT